MSERIGSMRGMRAPNTGEQEQLVTSPMNIISTHQCHDPDCVDDTVHDCHLRVCSRHRYTRKMELRIKRTEDALERLVALIEGMNASFSAINEAARMATDVMKNHADALSTLQSEVESLRTAMGAVIRKL